eukprot:scaffold34767_cov45-Isochrysis_galbana.AAC.1
MCVWGREKGRFRRAGRECAFVLAQGACVVRARQCRSLGRACLSVGRVRFLLMTRLFPCGFSFWFSGGVGAVLRGGGVNIQERRRRRFVSHLPR